MELINPSHSWQVFIMLESFSDSMGAWRFMDILGKPLMKLPDWLIQDLSTWRWISEIVRTQNRMIERGEDPFAVANQMNLNEVIGR